MGPIFGEGDSLITLLSLVGMPPQRTYLFLGCYFGLGFAPLESLVLLFCLKCLYPTKVYLLKGHLEEPASIKNLGLDDWLLRRKIPPESVTRVSEIVMRTVAQMPIGAMIGQKILCLPGGPGPIIREQGLAALKNCTRSSMNQLDRSICMEAAWAVMKLESNPVTVNDGIPTFTESQCSAFCKANGLVLLVDEGFLNYPKEVLTIVSAVAYLDNFRNYAAAITFQGTLNALSTASCFTPRTPKESFEDINRCVIEAVEFPDFLCDRLRSRASVVRYKMDEGEPKSLDIVKPGIGRNSMALPT
ncbi:hypothetical protein DICVIV_00937 [Dictyocaulus viviparus]|uniref:Serine/threonine specific protein phosphatases domain-containing protein n=1 Tax=Dictyocaulus viviparus TaxID=29172 RepID=A0A0D8YE45_DICVI|nr:hypothetical protein DICVIV_00937 [Dictyocaulus viviparus]